MLMRLLLAMPIVFIPNALHLPANTGIPGLNITNLLFVLVLLALLASGAERGGLPTERGHLTTALSGLFVALVLAFVIAQLTAPMDLMADLTDLKDAIFYPLLYFVYRRCRQDLQGTRQLIILTMVVAAVAGVEAVREGLQYGLGNFSESRRAAGPFGQNFAAANYAGVFFAMFLPMFIAGALFFRRQRLWRLASLGGCAVLAMAIMVTYSRQAYFIGLFALVLLLLRRNVVLAVLIGVVMAGSVGLLPDSVTQRVEETEQRDAAGGEELDVSTMSRIYIWKGAQAMWAEHPAGVGLNRFKSNIGQYTNYRGYDAHNVYVLVLSECGPLGLIAVLWLLWKLWTLAGVVRRSATPTDTEARTLGLGFSVAVISMALGNVYGSFLLEGVVMANFWILCGLLERYAMLKRGAHALADGTGREALPAPAAIGERFPLATRTMPGRYREHRKGDWENSRENVHESGAEAP